MILFKKSTALVLVLVFVLILLNQAGYAAGFSDTKGTSYQNKAEFLSTLGIMEANTGEDFGVDTEVTRSEFAVMVSKALGVSSIAKSSNKQVYTDVPPEHNAFSDINILFNMGIMLGSDDAKFRPDETIKYEEAVKTFIMATGYYYIAEEKGGYPVGYIMVGKEKGIIGGLNIPAGTAMKKGDLAILIYNSILADKFELNDKNSNISYGNLGGKNILSQAHSIYKAMGIVNGCEESSLVSVESKLPKGQVLIDDTIYYIGKTTVFDYLGMKIEFFYKQPNDDDYRTIIYITEREDMNDIIIVRAENILSSTSVNEFAYNNENDKSTKASISATARYIYNGKLLVSVVNDDLKPIIGNVTLIDTDGDQVFETVLIEEYKNYVVDSVVLSDGIVQTRFNDGTIDFDIDGNDSNTYFYKDGYETDISSVTQWSVISVLRSKNNIGKQLVQVYISEKKITGTVSEVFDEGDGDFSITLDTGDTYMLSESYKARAKAGINGCSYPKVGDKSDFHMDIFGNIEAKQIDASSNNNYGFLINAIASKGMGKNVSFKIFTFKQTIEIFEATAKVTVNGISKSGESILSDLKDPVNEEVIKPQLIIYNTTGEGLINEYKTATDKTSDTNYLPKEDEFVLSKKYESSGIRLYKQMSYRDNLAVGKSTIVFDIPSDLTKEKGYSIGRTFAIDESLKPPLYVYNVSDGGVIGVLVIMSGGAAGTKFNTPRVVEKISRVIDEEENAKTKIYFVGGSSDVCNTEDVTYSYLDWGYDDVTVSDLKEGDIVQYILKDNEIQTLRVLVRANNIGSLRTSEDDIVENGNQISKVISVSEDKKFMVVEYVAGGVTKKETRQIAGGVQRYNSSTGKMETSSPADIKPGDTVFLNTFWLSTTMIVIYR